MNFIRVPQIIAVILLVQATVFSPTVVAQSLTLADAVRESSGHSLVVQKAKASLEEFKWRKTEAYAGFLPSVTASVNYLTDKKYMLLDTSINGAALTIPQVVPTTLYSLRASLPIFDGFASTNRLRASYALQAAAQSEYEWTQFSTERQTVLQYYRALASGVLKDVATQNVKALEDHLRDSRAFKKAGVTTNYDLLRTEVQVSEAQSELLNAEDNVALAKYKLGEILGKEVETRLLVGELPVLSEDLIKNLNANFLETRKDILALRERSEAADIGYRSMNRYWVPRLSVYGETQYYNNRTAGFDDSDNFRNAYNVGVNLSWNIFDGLASTARSGQSEQQAIQVKKALQISEIKARQDFEFWKRKFKYYASVYRSRLNDVTRSNEAVRLSKEGRRAGVNTSTQLLDSESDLFRSRAGQVNAQMGAIEALVNLELVSGQQLYDFTK